MIHYNSRRKYVMIIASIAAATVIGAAGAAIAYALGYGMIGMLIAYALAGQVAFAVFIALFIGKLPEDDLDFQHQVELDLLAMKESLTNSGGKRAEVFRQKLQQQRLQDKRIPRPFNPQPQRTRNIRTENRRHAVA